MSYWNIDLSTLTEAEREEYMTNIGILGNAYGLAAKLLGLVKHGSHEETKASIDAVMPVHEQIQALAAIKLLESYKDIVKANEPPKPSESTQPPV